MLHYSVLVLNKKVWRGEAFTEILINLLKQKLDIFKLNCLKKNFDNLNFDNLGPVFPKRVFPIQNRNKKSHWL